MTASLGWALAHNAALLDRFVERVAPGVSLTEPPAIELQRHDRADGGFTDIELLAPELHTTRGSPKEAGCRSTLYSVGGTLTSGDPAREPAPTHRRRGDGRATEPRDRADLETVR